MSEGTTVGLHLITAAGEQRDIDARVGESIMLAAVRENVPGILADCGGQASCATCHVFLAREDWKLFPEPKEVESDMLEFTEGATEESRLSCQLKVSEQCEGVVVTVADNGF